MNYHSRVYAKSMETEGFPNQTIFDERPKPCYTDYISTERVTNVRKIIACILVCAAAVLCFAGCGSGENSKIVGKWQATKVKLNGETISFSQLDADGKEFSFDFREDGSCKAVLGGIENNGSYTFNQTTVDIMYGGREEKLKYDRGVLTLTFYYNNEPTSYMFTKIE